MLITYIWIDVIADSSDGHKTPPEALRKCPRGVCLHINGSVPVSSVPKNTIRMNQKVS